VDVLRRRDIGVMGTDLVVEAIGPDPALLELALDAAVEEIRRVEDMMTTLRDSPLTRLVAAAGQGPMRVPEELAALVARGKQIGELTGGAFDMTYAGVGRLWDFKRDPPVIPDADAVAAALQFVDYRRVEVDLEANTITLPEGMAVGLGGIAKGYGVDRAMAVLMEHGVEHALVNAGGDLKALGRKFGEPWRIAIRNPRNRDEPLAMIPVSNTCMVTSGNYERFFMVDGKRYHHVLDPRTGYPADGCTSVTVLAQDAAFAAALATALMVIGPEQGMELVEALPRVEALLVDMQGEIFTSSGLE